MSRREGARRFATILFTDIVGSTEIARELGDARWRELQRRHHAIVRRELKRFGGHEVDTAGDGFFAIFDSPGAAIRCAVAISEAVRDVGLEVRAGLHGGEVAASEGKPGGIAVNTGARVMAVAGFGEVLVSQTLRDVVAGSTIGFEDHGVHTLKGIAGEWRLFRVAAVDGERVAEPLDGAEAAKRRLAIEPAATPLRSRRSALVAGVVGAAVVIAGVVGFLVTRGDGSAPSSAGGASGHAAVGPPGSALVKLDATTGKVDLVRTDVPGRAFGITQILWADGSLWMIRPPIVLKIDPQDGSSTTVNGLAGTEVDRIGAGLGRVWAIGGSLWPVDPATARTGKPIDYGQHATPMFNSSAIAAGFGSVWIARSSGEVDRLDPKTGRIRVIDIGDTPSGLALGATDVWVLDASANSIWRIDPANDRALDPIPFTGHQDAIAIGQGFVWVLDGTIGTLTPIDEASGDVRSPIDVGAGATSVAVGDGTVWVASGGDVREISPASFTVVRTFHVSDRPIATIAVDDTGALWLDMARPD